MAGKQVRQKIREKGFFFRKIAKGNVHKATIIIATLLILNVAFVACRPKVQKKQDLEYVYISTGKHAKRFHVSSNCMGLRNSKHIMKVSLEEAQNRYNRSPCKLCCVNEYGNQPQWEKMQEDFSLTDREILALKKIVDQKKLSLDDVSHFLREGYTVDEIIVDID